MGDVGDEGDVVDEQLWGDDKDKPEQSKAEEKYEKDAPVQVSSGHAHHLEPLRGLWNLSEGYAYHKFLLSDLDAWSSVTLDTEMSIL